ncbi:hypothetical protein [Cohnella sp.]|uniref:hypothetical protein n=1 Tax=Cohnella sp. TaxID=1883426 RepID=UPI0035667B95
MPGKIHSLCVIGSVLLLAATLISCGSSAGQPISPALDTPPPITAPIQGLPAEEPRDDFELHPDQPSDAPEPKPAPAAPKKQPASTAPAVEASTIEPNPKKQELPPETAFQPESPSLGGIGLGATDKDVFKQFGLPLDTYPLPGGAQTVDIWEYSGFSIGLNSQDKVVYVEISSAEVRTGIRGLANGMDGAKAALLLGLPNDDQTHVLTLEVTGGWIKLDLDPETQNVLSLKLLSNDI